MPTYYTQNGAYIRNPQAYARTSAPMYKTKYTESSDINTPTAIYKLNLENGKKYIGKTNNVYRRMTEHFSGNGSQVTKKFKPVSAKIVDKVPGFFSDKKEQEQTDKYVNKYGYSNVRGGKYTNSKTLKHDKHRHTKSDYYTSRYYSEPKTDDCPFYINSDSDDYSNSDDY